MNHVIIQPVGKKEAQENLQTTVFDQIALEKIELFFNDLEVKEIKKLSSNNLVPMWAVKDSVGNQRQYDKMQIGDVILFGTNQNYHHKATIAYLTINEPFGLDVLGVCGDKKHTNIMFLKDIEKINIDYVVFNTEVGYKDKFAPQGVTVLDDQKSKKYFDAF